MIGLQLFMANGMRDESRGLDVSSGQREERRWVMKRKRDREKKAKGRERKVHTEGGGEARRLPFRAKAR